MHNFIDMISIFNDGDSSTDTEVSLPWGMYLILIKIHRCECKLFVSGLTGFTRLIYIFFAKCSIDLPTLNVTSMQQ